SDLPREEYEQLTWLTCKSIVSGPRAVFDQAEYFLTWLWDLPGYEKHKQYFQGCLETTDLADALGGLIDIGVLEPVHKILDPASTLNTKLFTLTCREGGSVCYSLYTQNEQKLLQKLLGSIKTTVKKPTKKFLEKLDQDVLQKLESVFDKKLLSHKGEGDSCSSDNVAVSLQAFNFYKQYDRQSLETLLCDILGGAKGGKLLHKIDQVMSNKLGNMIANTQKSYKESLFFNSSDSDHHDTSQDDSGSSDTEVLVMGEGHTAEFTNS
ncbi:MAG: hypothetical protein ACEY3D_04065, partial [Rickettsia sp.]|uniref:hypothetical protein n=1 Tax=Rickettsia sp. TaxID=789 RepID=UPI00397C8815